jgi:hypothetical protein
MALPTQEGGALFVAIAFSWIADTVGMSWWQASVVGLLVWIGLLGMIKGRPAP